jgi:hypothetical protein
MPIAKSRHLGRRFSRCASEGRSRPQVVAKIEGASCNKIRQQEGHPAAKVGSKQPHNVSGSHGEIDSRRTHVLSSLTEGRYRQATGPFPASSAQRKLNAVKGIPALARSWIRRWGIGTGAGLCDFYRARDRRRAQWRQWPFAALVRRRAGR